MSISSPVSPREAEQALDDAGLRPVEEVVFVQSDELTVEDPEFRAAIEDVTGRLSQMQVRRERRVAADRRRRGLGRRPRRAGATSRSRATRREAADRVDPTLAAVAAVQADHPGLDIEQFGGASANKAINEIISDDLAKAGMLSLPITLIILIITFGTLVAAGLPLLIGLTVRDGRARPRRDHEPPASRSTATSRRSSC